MKVELNKIAEDIFEIPKKGNMLVPGRIFASEKLLKSITSSNDRALEQVINVAHLPGIQKYSIGLPDIHQGYGFSIGGVAALSAENGGISPGGVGYDINCGVRLLKTDLFYSDLKENDVRNLVDTLFKSVPAGVGEGNADITPNQLDDVLENGSQWALENGFGTEDDIKHTEDQGKLKGEKNDVSRKAKSRGRPQLGSLGSGNHFLEIQVVDEIFDTNVAKTFNMKDEQICVMIHCGSRGLGHQVATDYLREMDREFKNLVEKLPDRQLLYAPIKSDLAMKYINAMNAAANFAFANRQMIAHHVREGLHRIFPDAKVEQLYDVCHNIAKKEKHTIDGDAMDVWVHRKGATRSIPKGHPLVPEAYKDVGQPVIIPGSMGTGSYILVGTEEALSLTFGSTAHGAGRTMSRTKALKKYRGNEVRRDLQSRNIYVKGHSLKGIAEEAPLAYKNIDDVVDVSHRSKIGTKVVRLRPMGVIKG
ncbi:MAG: RtcB family protein [Candidatus Hodarchaeales archaeon]|jgi:tRNA-splicing ligase RtcB